MKLPVKQAGRAFLLFLLGALACQAQAPVEVRSPSVKVLETAPGRTVTASVVVENHGSAAEEFTDRLTLPAGCQRIAPPELPFSIEAGARLVRVLAVALPDNMPAGAAQIHYAVQARRDPAVTASYDFGITVAPVESLTLVLEPGVAMALAGDSYQVKMKVTNGGNSRLAVQLSARSSLGFALKMETAGFPLEAGATRELTCSVQTAKGFAKHTSHAVTFEATAASTSGQALKASQASVVEMIPLISGSRDPYHYLPMQLTLSALGESGHSARLQAELSGEGSLDEAGQEQVSFLFRGPEVQDSSLFGERDEYGASYRGETWGFDLGDRVFSLSPLTEKHTLGRGAGVTWHDGENSASAFAMTTRYRRQNSVEVGAEVRHELSPNFALQANFLRKSAGDVGLRSDVPQNIATVEAHGHEGKLIEYDVEAGLSESDRGQADIAVRAEARGVLPGKVTYAVEHVHAGPNFHGYESSGNTTYVSVAQAITPAFRTHVSASYDAGNTAVSDVRTTVVNRESSWNAGAAYLPAKNTELSVAWLHTKRQDILAPAAYDFTEDALRLGVSQTLGALQLQSFLDLGTLDNSLTGESGHFERYSGLINWRPSPHQTYSAFASYGPSSSTGSREHALGAGLSAGWRVSDRFEATVSGARNQYDGLLGREQDQAMLSLRYRFANQCSLSILGRWSKATTKTPGASSLNESAVMVSYSVPLSLPVSRKRSVGILAGRLTDSSKNAGVARVVLQVGEQFAVTDETGCFEFPNLKPGSCELSVLADSLGPHLAMITPLPLKLRIRPAETTRATLEVTAASSIAIRVLRYEFADGNALHGDSELRVAGGLSAAVVEITHGRDVWRGQTDRTGSASFDRLPPGTWKIRIASSDLPPLSTIENSERTVSLAVGHSEEVTVRVLPQRRTLRLLERGTIR